TPEIFSIAFQQALPVNHFVSSGCTTRLETAHLTATLDAQSRHSPSVNVLSLHQARNCLATSSLPILEAPSPASAKYSIVSSSAPGRESSARTASTSLGSAEPIFATASTSASLSTWSLFVAILLHIAELIEAHFTSAPNCCDT